MGTKHLTPTAQPNNPTYDVSANAWNEDHIMDDTTPPTPAAGKLALLVKSITNVLFPAYITPDAKVFAIQPNCFTANFGYSYPTSSNSSDFTLLNSPNVTFTGTIQISLMTSTSLFGSLARRDMGVTTASTTAVAGFVENHYIFTRGNASGVGGFITSIIWGQGLGASNTSKRAFAGLYNQSAAPTDVDPSTLLNIIGMGWDSADTNIQIMHNDGSGTATKINLGASFPIPTSNYTNFYQVIFSCKPNDTVVHYYVKNMTTLAEASGTISTDLPAAGEILRRRGYTSVGGVSAQTGFSFFGMCHNIG